MKNNGMEITSSDANNLLDIFDKDKDGKLSYADVSLY